MFPLCSCLSYYLIAFLIMRVNTGIGPWQWTLFSVTCALVTDEPAQEHALSLSLELFVLVPLSASFVPYQACKDLRLKGTWAVLESF